MKSNEKNSIDFLVRQGEASPHKTAFIILENEEGAERKISYSELYLKVRNVAAILSGAQLSGKRALLIYQDILEFIIAFLACQYNGTVAVPVPYIKGKRQLTKIASIIDDAQVAGILCTGNSHSHLQQGLSDILTTGAIAFIPTDDKQPGDLSDALPQRIDNATAFIQYTSGSTGNPKGVVVSNKSLLHNQQLIRDTFLCNEDSVIFSWLPFHHDMGLIGNILHSIYVGCTCVLMSPLHFIQKPKAWLKGITAYKVTHSGGPNFAYDLCVDKIPADELASLDLSSWKVAYNGSEPVQAATLQRFTEHFRSAGFAQDAFTPCYGLAEATLLVAGTKTGSTPATITIDKEASADGKILMVDVLEGQIKTVVSSGLPAEGISVKIISVADQHECAELEEGEICIAGESVTEGYWNKDNQGLFYEYAGEKFLRTGDLGFRYREELFVNGRLKEMLIVRGRNYYPYDIEQLVSDCNDAIESHGVAVFALEEEVIVVAEIKRAFVHNLQAEAIISAINKSIQGYLGIAPSDVVLTTPQSIPRTTSGKLQRVKCKSHYTNSAFTVIASKEGMSGLMLSREREPELLADVLQNPRYTSIRAYVIDMIEAKKDDRLPVILDDEADLTTLGVDSLRSMELINSINQELNICLDATKIYQHNTLSAICNAIEALLWLNADTIQTSGEEITI